MNRIVGLLTLAGGATMVAGFLREAMVAFRFGASGDADAVAVAMVYLDGVTAVAVVGVAGVMMVPVIARVSQAQGVPESLRLMDSCLLWAAIVMVPLGLAGLFLPDVLARIAAPEFPPDRLRALTTLLAFGAPTIVLVVLSGVMAGVLQAHRDYFSPVHGRTLFALAVAAAVLLFPSAGVTAVGVGMLVGVLLLVAAHVRGLMRLGWRPRRPAFAHAGLAHALQMAVPILLALVLINIVMGGVQRMAASGLPEGGLAAMTYALRALNLVAGLTMSLATVSLTELALKYEAEGMGPGTRAVLEDALTAGVWMLVPLTFLLLAMSEPFVALLFYRGEYDDAALRLTAQCLRWLTGAIVPGMVVAVLLRAAPAFGRPWRSALIGAVWMSATVAATIALLPAMGAVALAAGHSIGITVAAGASILILRDLIPLPFYRLMMVDTFKWVAFSAVGLVVTQGVVLWVGPQEAYGLVESAGRLLLIAVVFLFCAGGAAILTGDRRTREAASALLAFRHRLY